MGAPAISLERLKTHLRVDHDEEDTYLQGLLDAAFDYCENFTGRILQKRQLEVRLDGFPPGVLHVRAVPLHSVDSLSYVNREGSLVTIDAAEYQVIPTVEPPLIVPEAGWPADVFDAEGTVHLVVTAGFDPLPSSIEQAILLLCGHYYDNREVMRERFARATEMPFGVSALLYPYKIWGW